jgi:hypothetical protein
MSAYSDGVNNGNSRIAKRMTTPLLNISRQGLGTDLPLCFRVLSYNKALATALERGVHAPRVTVMVVIRCTISHQQLEETVDSMTTHQGYCEWEESHIAQQYRSVREP